MPLDSKITILDPFLESKVQDEKNELEIIHQDEDIIIVNKPPFILSHKTPSPIDELRDTRPCIVEMLKNKGIELAREAQKDSSGVGLKDGIVHRLDYETSGIMVLAKTKCAMDSLQNQIRKKTARRYYLALIDKPLREQEHTSYLTRDKKGRISSIQHEFIGDLVSINGLRARYAKSYFTPLESNLKSRELLAIKLHTGRTHQIRSQLKELNRFILGDKLYAPKSIATLSVRCMLHAYCLCLTHPSSKKRLIFFASIPQDMLKSINSFMAES